MTEIRYEDAVEILLQRFPEFLDADEYDTEWLDLPYLIWGGFGSYITRYIRALPEEKLDDDELVIRLFDFTNEIMDHGDSELTNLAIIELFENFYTYRKTLDLARRKLKEKHLPWLEKHGSMFRTIDEA